MEPHPHHHQVQQRALVGVPSCPYLRPRRCLFGHSSNEVASASLVGVQLPVSGPTREEHEALVAAVRRLAAALMWSRGTAVEPVMTAQDEFGERIPERIVKQTFDIAAPTSTNRGAESGGPDASDYGLPTSVGQR